MRKLLFSLICCLMVGMGAKAQSAADKIVGTYKAVQDGNVSKVKISKNGDGYKVQIIWLEKPNNDDGTPKLDKRNPDKSKRSVHADKIVLAEKLKYEDGVWTDGKIYDPTKGKSFDVEMKFKNAKTLKVKGSFLLISQTVEWTKID